MECSVAGTTTLDREWETGGPGENHPPVASHWQALSHDVAHLSNIEFSLSLLYNQFFGTDKIYDTYL
jgi:hypothetical protein